MNLCIRTKCFRSNIIGSLYRYSTTATEPIEQNDQVLIDDSDDARAREEEIEKKRNVSRLSQEHYNLVNGRRPYEEPKHTAHLTVKYNRKMYGKYGIASGVNPSLCWPSKKDIQDTLEYESVAYPFTIQEMMASAAQKRKEAQLQIEQREKDVAAKYAKLAQWKKDLQDKIAKKEYEARAAKEKKERLVEEVRRHFGFKLDPRDERFQEMLAKREKEQKKQEKLAKREAKEKMMIAKLQQQNSEISETAEKS
ncbi:growth arrest and DNA damage-inducible proteins-interacting protein 1 [Pectinophora gossypiella]|uniref:growth arrest and DNA damage-inducible proteins-interacting protein 1 n=1 Tax=Pectinophora gossypiella TaxID=13191 RepID=UPI00214ED99E|nr:growth arrest and DNA damage-inducible proteins-interacting protein 1 [Pectinophora gossypiella]